MSFGGATSQTPGSPQQPGQLGLGQGFSSAQPQAAPGPGMGQYNTGITAGALPQSMVQQASGQMMQPMMQPSPTSPGNSGIGGGSGGQFAQLMQGLQTGGDLAMQRQFAPQQAQQQLAQQSANAQAGVGNANLLNNFQANNINAQAPYRQFMMNYLGQQV